MTLRFLVILMLLLSISGAVTVWAVTRSSPLAGAALTLWVGVFIVAVAGLAFRMLWQPMLAPFPARPPAPDAVHRRFQSFSVGIVNMGFSIHVAVDEAFLHLRPVAPWRWLGARDASIPWTAMTPVGRAARVARLPGGHQIVGPRWCMRLVGAGRTDAPPA
ncbi:MAG: hypothetical protein KF817_10165 [Phycisphaeraceae bacterium]|nr:hypothetical protein [Phycisphaeraceae bacterium]